MGKKSGGGEAAAAREAEEKRQAAIRAGTARIDDIFNQQFTPEFFDARRDAYLDYATPQLEDQHKDAQEQLAFSLARAGLLDSSSRAARESELTKMFDTQKQKIADDALNFANTARSNVETARSNLVSTLNATGDTESAVNGALTRAQTLSAAPTFSPLTQLFSQFTSTLGTQAALEKADALSGGQTGVRYKTGLFTPSPGAVQVTG